MGTQLVFGMLRLAPIDAASAIGGWVARTVGPWLPVSETGRGNLRRAFPEKRPDDIERILRGVWENLGRTAAEYAHLRQIWDYDPGADGPPGRIEVVGLDDVIDVYRLERPVVIFAAHLGNWELPSVGARRHGLPLAVLFRPPNNPFVAALAQRIRGRAMGELLPKGLDGGVAAARVLENGGYVGMLVDQHFSRGVRVPFFGRDAWTSPILAKLARRFDYPVHGARVERLGGARFRVTFTPALDLPRSVDAKADAVAVMTRVNAMIESWVRERPEQWLWLHRRWRD